MFDNKEILKPNGKETQGKLQDLYSNRLPKIKL